MHLTCRRHREVVNQQHIATRVFPDELALGALKTVQTPFRVTTFDRADDVERKFNGPVDSKPGNLDVLATLLERLLKEVMDFWQTRGSG